MTFSVVMKMMMVVAVAICFFVLDFLHCRNFVQYIILSNDSLNDSFTCTCITQFTGEKRLSNCHCKPFISSYITYMKLPVHVY